MGRTVFWLREVAEIITSSIIDHHPCHAPSSLSQLPLASTSLGDEVFPDACGRGSGHEDSRQSLSVGARKMRHAPRHGKGHEMRLQG